MRKNLIIGILLTAMVLVGWVVAHSQSVLNLEPGQFAVQGDIMVWYSFIPLTVEEGKTYGRRGDKLDEKILIPELPVVAVYDQIKELKTEKGWPEVKTVVIGFDSVTIEKYKWSNYDLLSPKILTILNLLTPKE